MKGTDEAPPAVDIGLADPDRPKVVYTPIDYWYTGGTDAPFRASRAIERRRLPRFGTVGSSLGMPLGPPVHLPSRDDARRNGATMPDAGPKTLIA